MLLVGLDLGTQGVRALATDVYGKVRCQKETVFDETNDAQPPYREQNPLVWVKAVKNVLSALISELRSLGEQLDDMVIAVDGTSGTIVPVDRNDKPLMNGILYNDPRATEEAQLVQKQGKDIADKLGYQFGASFSLPRMLWIRRHMPKIFEKTACFLHQADYIVGYLTGNFRITDYSNALKSGFDLFEQKWPAFIENLGIMLAQLPEVETPGTCIGTIREAVARETGLPRNTRIALGATDGYAAAVASGAVAPGEFNSTIGSTLIIKGVTKQLIKDPLGRVYCHRHPQGYWMPGGAGNTGGLALNAFGKENFNDLNRMVSVLSPTGALVYPLTGTGERFPFVSPTATGFAVNVPEDAKVLYAATMEGVGYVERLSYEMLQSLGCEVGPSIAISGGAVKSPEWSQLRANILRKTLVQPRHPDSAMGSAIIAGTDLCGRELIVAAREMVHTEREFEPQEENKNQYETLYMAFCEECKERGYLG